MNTQKILEAGQIVKQVKIYAKSIVKKDTFEWIVEKATELGVSHIIPLISDRSEKKDINKGRLIKISIEAAEQSGRATTPVIHEVMNMKKALTDFQKIKSIIWDPSAVKFSPAELADMQGIYIGPEGGWTPAELALFQQRNILVRSLGPQILKAETAVIATLSRLVF